MVQIDLVPSDIRFMHNRISNKFSNGNSVNGTINDIENGHMSVDDLPRIKVVHKDGNYYSFDNRRLYVFRVLHYRGCLDKVTVKLASIKQFQPWRFTTKNDGKTVIVNRDITYKHSGLKLDSNIANESSYYENSQSDEDDDNTDDVDDDHISNALSFATNYLRQMEKLRLVTDAEQSCESDKRRSAESLSTTSSQRNSFSSTQSSEDIQKPNSTESLPLWQAGTSSSLARNHSGDMCNRSARVERWLSSRSDVEHVTYSPRWKIGGSNYNRNDSCDTWSSTAQYGRSNANNYPGETRSRSAHDETWRSSRYPVRSDTGLVFGSSRHIGGSSRARIDSSDAWSTIAQVGGRRSSKNSSGSTANDVANTSLWQTGSTSSLKTRSQRGGLTSKTVSENNSYRVFLESRSTEPFVALSDCYENRFRASSPSKSTENSWCTIL